MIIDALLLEAILLLALSVGLSVWQRDVSTKGRLAFCAVCLAAAAMTLGELLALRGITSELVADRIKYAGAITLPPLWLGFACHVTRVDVARRIPWFPALLLVPGLLFYAIMLSPRFGSLFMTTVDGGDDLHGSLWWVSMVYGQTLALAGSAVLTSAALRSSRRPDRSRRLLLAAASLLPIVGNALYVGTQISWPYDPTSILFGVVLVVMRSAVFEGGLLEPLPISQRELIHQLPLGVILTDRHGHVVEISDTAANRLGVFEEFALGRSLDQVLAWSEPTPMHALDVTRRGSPAGQLVLLE
jgi:PAS domain-containing protein